MIRKEACSDFSFLIVLRLVLCPIIWSILEKVSHALEKNVYSDANNYFIYCYFVVPVLAAYIIIAIVFLMNFSFTLYTVHFVFCYLFFFSPLALMSILSDMNMGMLTFFWLNLLTLLFSIPSSLVCVCL